MFRLPRRKRTYSVDDVIRLFMSLHDQELAKLIRYHAAHIEAQLATVRTRCAPDLVEEVETNAVQFKSFPGPRSCARWVCTVLWLQREGHLPETPSVVRRSAWKEVLRRFGWSR